MLFIASIEKRTEEKFIKKEVSFLKTESEKKYECTLLSRMIALHCRMFSPIHSFFIFFLVSLFLLLSFSSFPSSLFHVLSPSCFVLTIISFIIHLFHFLLDAAFLLLLPLPFSYPICHSFGLVFT